MECGVLECWSIAFKTGAFPDPSLQYSILQFLHPVINTHASLVQLLHEAFLFNFVDQAHVDELGWVSLPGVDREENILDPFQFRARRSRQAVGEKFVGSLHRLSVGDL